MTSRVEVILLGAEIHRGPNGDEVGTATFVKMGGPAQAFTVDTTAELAMQLLKSGGTRFAIVIEQVTTTLSSPGGWPHRLLSAVALPPDRK